MCRGRHGDDPVQWSSSHRSQTKSAFGREIRSQLCGPPAQQQLWSVLSGCRERERERVDLQREMEQHFGRGVRHALALGVARPGERHISISKPSIISVTCVTHRKRMQQLDKSSDTELREGFFCPPYRHSPRDGTTHKKVQCHNPAAAEHKNVRVIHVNVPPLLRAEATRQATHLFSPSRL